MGLKKWMNSAILAGAALAGGAQAQSVPVKNLTNDISWATNSTLNGPTDPRIWKQLIANNLRFSEKISDTTTVGIIGEYDGKFGAGGTIEWIYTGNTIAIGWLIKKLQDAQYFLGGASMNINSINITGTISTGKQSAKRAIENENIEGYLTGNKATLSVTLQEYNILDNLGFKLTHAKTNESALRTDSIMRVEVQTEDLGQMIKTLTKDYNNITHTYWTGGTINEASLVAWLRLNTNHRLDLTIGKQRESVLGDNKSYTTGSINYTYVPSANSKFKIGYNSSGQSQQASLEYSHLMDNKQGELVLGVRNNRFDNGIRPSTDVYAWFRYTMGWKAPAYSTNNSTRTSREIGANLRAAMKDQNIVNPQSIGRVATREEKVLTKEVATYAPKEILTAFGAVKVNPDGTITVEFGTNTNSSQKSFAAASLSTSNIPVADIKYCLKIKKSNGTIMEDITIAPPSWTSSTFEEGTYTMVIITTNTVDGKQTVSKSQEYQVVVEKDSKEEINLEVIKTEYDTALLRYKAEDLDGIKNVTWKIDGSSSATLEVDTDAKTILVKKATPGETLTIILEWENAVKWPDGKLTWKPFDPKKKEITLLKAVDAPTTINLEAGDITTNSILAKCNIKDLDGAVGVCTIRTKAGALIQSWTIWEDKRITGLLPGAQYTLAIVEGSAGERQTNNSLNKKSINQLKDFTTVALTIPNVSFGGAVTGIVWGTHTRTLSTDSVGPITYSSSNPAVATVSATGLVTYLTAGNTTITANQAANGDYTGGSASYGVTVSIPLVDTPAVVTLPTTSITSSGIAFSGGTVSDVDAPGGFNFNISYTVKDTGGNVVNANSLNPSSNYTYTMQYNSWNKATNTMIIGEQTAPQSFVTLAAADTTAPTITLNGADTINIVQGGTYTELGANWTDAVDGSGTVTAITGSVNTAVVGIYTLTYSKTDAAGNTNTTSRTVNVTLAPDPIPTSDAIPTFNIGDLTGVPQTVTLPTVTDTLWRPISCTISGFPTTNSLWEPVSITLTDNSTLRIQYDVNGWVTALLGKRICDAWASGNILDQTIPLNITDQG